MLRILWMSRHRPLSAQQEWLNDRFGVEVEIVQDPNPFDNAQAIAKRYRQGNFDDIVVVAPLSVIAKLIELGIKPMWAEMDQISVAEAKASPHDSVVIKGRRGYRFTHFSRIVAIEFKFEEV